MWTLGIERTALVTGAAGGGIGTATALALARAGIHVFANGRPSHSEYLEQLSATALTQGLSIEPAIFDVSDEAAVAYFAREQAGRDRSVGILVHNAALSLPAKPLISLELSDWHREFEVSADGAFLLTRFLAPRMFQERWGRLIYISSSAAFRGARGRSAGYSAAKAALLGLCAQAAIEGGPFGVTANAIAPSQIDTPRIRRNGRRNDRSLQAYADRIPLARVGDPNDVAALVKFLASADSSYITGQTFHVNGGSHLADRSSQAQNQ